MADIGIRLFACAAGCALLVSAVADSVFHGPAITYTGAIAGAVIGAAVVLIDKARSA